MCSYFLKCERFYIFFQYLYYTSVTSILNSGALGELDSDKIKKKTLSKASNAWQRSGVYFKRKTPRGLRFYNQIAHTWTLLLWWHAYSKYAQLKYTLFWWIWYNCCEIFFNFVFFPPRWWNLLKHAKRQGDNDTGRVVMVSQYRKWTWSEPFTLHHHRLETCHVFRWLQGVAYVSKCCWYADGRDINDRCSATDVLIIYTQVELESGGCSDMRYPSGTHLIFTFGEFSFALNWILNCLIRFKQYTQNDIDVTIYSAILQNNSNGCYGRTRFLDVKVKHAFRVDIATALSNKHKWFTFLNIRSPTRQNVLADLIAVHTEQIM